MGLKILLLSHCFHPDIGGIEVNSEIYALAFTAAGHEVRVVTWTTTEATTTFPFQVIRSPSSRALLREHAWADIVFENNPCLRLAWPALLFRQPSVVSLNTELPPTTVATWLKRLWLRRANAVIAVSEAVRQHSWPSAQVISNPYREQVFRILPTATRQHDFVFLGRLVSQKGAHHAVQAFAQVLARLGHTRVSGPAPRLTIIGDGPERPHLEHLVASLGLAAQVVFTGFLQGEALVQQLNQHRFLLVPSLTGEAFGNVVLEGLACGCLPLVSDSGGLPAAVGRAGLIFKQDDAASLADCMWRILHTPDLEYQLRQEAAAHLGMHQSTAVAQRYLQVLQHAVTYQSIELQPSHH
jgi:glycosyltransferase involved in cell wall biosynthesis